MTSDETLVTQAQNTWCPGCGNFAIQHAMKFVIQELEAEGMSRDQFVLVSGIGCHAKIADYFQLNSFYSLHGRTIPVATGIKMANPDLKVICFAGDGDLYAEGLDHLIHAAKRNMDITVICHNNRVYGLTTGQYTPTSPYGYKGKSTPQGLHEYPLNVIELLLGSGATFVSRAYSRHLPHLRRIFKEAIMHPGFAHVDVLQICASFFNMTTWYDERIYETSESNAGLFEFACRTAQQWNYNDDAKIPIGIFFQTKKPVLPEKKIKKEVDRSSLVKTILDRAT
ncbi:MAG TPA: thiamine pyrophosphate-dependent enzyme [Methanospirillum sp.]|uniref:thiamine pyrophosphate-dependent enzyme n=1 Tax=Methanospirillum sp. TaxID=45200 RepID=UPI002C7FDED4|nr:thiamine pyrophosphate-dependent enzyme [Methanospirillum sp.]HWQ62900.1 thiamine pyrophosphate-dependent enzyme [Methanospirillum sp.]